MVDRVPNARDESRWRGRFATAATLTLLCADAGAQQMVEEVALFPGEVGDFAVSAWLGGICGGQRVGGGLGAGRWFGFRQGNHLRSGIHIARTYFGLKRFKKV